MDIIPFSLPTLSPWQKARMISHAEKWLLAQQTISQKPEENILHHTLRSQQLGSQPTTNQYEHRSLHMRMQHYPQGDRIDYRSGAQYFYHCHRENVDHEEHGHFHCFLRYRHIPNRIKPKRLKDWDKHIDSPMTHIVAIGMDRYGRPLRLFTVNRWVTSEIWYNASHMSTLTRRFKLNIAHDPHWSVLDQWIESTLFLFSPQITWLQQQRDVTIQRYEKDYPDHNAYENRDLEELSEITIDIQQQIAWIIQSP